MKNLTIVKQGKVYRLIGSIYLEDAELAELNKKGFAEYWQAVEARDKFGYEDFNLILEFEQYLFNEKQLIKASDQWWENKTEQNEQLIDILTNKLNKQVKMCCEAYHITSEQFVEKLNIYSETLKK